MARTTVINLAKDRDGLDPRQHRESCNRARRAECPHWSETGKPRGQARLDAFTNVQPEFYSPVAVKLDCSALGATKHLAAQLPSAVVKKCSVDSARLVGPDVAKECHQGGDPLAVEFQRRVKPDHLVGDIVWELEAARYQIAGNPCALRTLRLAPDVQRECATGAYVVRLRA